MGEGCREPAGTFPPCPVGLVRGEACFQPFGLHNPHIVDSLGNFPGSTSCSEGGEMSD